MTEDAALAQQCSATFDAELAERTATLERGLATLHKPGDSHDERTIGMLAQVAYNLQAAALVCDVPDTAHLAGSLVAALDAALREGVPLGHARLAALRRATSFLPTLVAAERSGQPAAGHFDVLADLVAGEAPPAPLALPLPPPPSALVAEQAPAAANGPATSIRVDVGKLDALLAQTGELAVTRSRVEQRLSELSDLRDDLGDWRREWQASRRLRASLRQRAANVADDPTLAREIELLLRAAEQAEARVHAFGQQVTGLTARLRQDVGQLGTVAHDLGEEVLNSRLIPAATIFSPFERLVRDLAREQGKEIALRLDGGEIEIDRKILDQLRDPLMHMLRNSVDHGIESAEQRAASGKSATSRIALAVANRGGVIAITLSDDGAGLDPARLRATAIRRGLLGEAQAAALDDHAAFALIFQPGFSTMQQATATSGRGVGMDVVRDVVTNLNGHIHIASDLGVGTTFTITVPLTLATTRAILVEQGERRFAIPSMPIERNGRVRAADLITIEGRRAVLIDGHPVPIVELAEVLALPVATWPADPRAWRCFVLLRQDERRVALLIDRLVGEQELVVKPLGWPLRRVRNVGGAAVLGSGETIAILNPADLLVGGQRLAQANTGASALPAPKRAVAPVRRRVLIVDDSLTTRLLERSILESAGYDTAVATDGAEALAALARDTVDIVVSDVEMPTLDGFGLTAAIRRDERLRHLPVILVTSLDSADQRERGIVAGADAYLSKRTFDQGLLLDTIGRLL